MKNLLDESPHRDEHGGTLYGAGLVGAANLSGKDVLDIGCGFGWFAVHALGSGAQSATGIEPVEADLSTARGQIHDERATFVAAGGESLPFDDWSFDTVVMWEVLEHVPKHTEPRVFAEVTRVLRPGGRFFLSTPFRSVRACVTDPAWWLIGHRHYSRQRLLDFASEAGLEVEHLDVRGGGWQILHMNNMYVAKWIFRRRPFFEAASLARLDCEWFGRSGYTNAVLTCQKPI